MWLMVHVVKVSILVCRCRVVDYLTSLRLRIFVYLLLLTPKSNQNQNKRKRTCKKPEKSSKHRGLNALRSPVRILCMHVSARAGEEGGLAPLFV
jgi:hypothetical protein